MAGLELAERLSSMSKFRSFLTHQRLPWVLAAVGMVLTLPSLFTGWAMDDHVLRYASAGGEGISSELHKPTGLFGFLGDPEIVQSLKERGSLPWWTADGFLLAFWRPLSSLTHWIDFRLWPDNPLLMHLQGILWYGLLVFVVTHLYRQTLTPAWVAGLAALLFAVDDAHGQAVAWISARNSLLATIFGSLALIAHDRWRNRGWKAGAFFGPLAFLLSLLSKEMGAAFGGYVAAHVAFLDKNPWRTRFGAFAPYAAVLLGWRLLYRALGYGVSASGMYVDPLAEPSNFAAAVVERAPAMILGLWAPPPADLATFGPEPLPSVIWLIGTMFLVLLVILFKPFLDKERTARFWATGMILSLLLTSASFPANRYLLVPSLGAMGLLALFLQGWRDGWPGSSRSQVWRGVAKVSAVFFVVTHLVLAPFALPYAAWALAAPAGAAANVARSLPDDPALSEQQLVIVNAPDFLLFTGFLFPIRFIEQLPVAKRQSVLATGPVELSLRRVDERTIVIRSDQGFPSGFTDGVYRSGDQPFAPGQRIQLPGISVEVVAIHDKNLIREAVFRFGVPLEDRSLRWFRWDTGAFVSFQPPGIGDTIRLEPARFSVAAPVERRPAVVDSDT